MCVGELRGRLRPALQDLQRRAVLRGEQLKELCRHRHVLLALEAAPALSDQIALGHEIADRAEAAERLVPAVAAHRLEVEQRRASDGANRWMAHDPDEREIA